MSESDQHVTANSPGVRVTDRRRVLRPLALATPLALLLLVTACGSDTSTPPASAPSSTTSSDSSTTTSDSSSGGADKMELTAVVGEEGNVDAFTITLMDSTGAPVTSLKAGDYTVKVKDLSKIHNFNLSGTGVMEKTTVPEVKEVTWTVKFEAGEYTFKCDPHPKMMGTFTVT